MMTCHSIPLKNTIRFPYEKIPLANSVLQQIRFICFDNCDLITKSTEIVPLNKYAIKKRRFIEPSTQPAQPAASTCLTQAKFSSSSQANQKPSRREWRKLLANSRFEQQTNIKYPSSSMDREWFLFNIHTNAQRTRTCHYVRIIAFKF